MKKLFLLFFLSVILLTSCGKKGSLTYPGEQKRPKFDNVIDEE